MSQNNSQNSAISASDMLVRINKFIDSLHPSQKDLTPDREYALFPFEHNNRETFDYFATSSAFTRGLPLRYLNPDQLGAFNDLLRVSLSEKGFKMVEQLRLLENVLTMREKDLPNWYIRDPLAYYVAIFGTPAEQGVWSWRFQGHHISLQWAIANNKVVSSTPQFLGCQPSVIKEDEGSENIPVGLRVLGQYEDLARNLIDSLTDADRKKGWVDLRWDIETTNVSDPRTQRSPHRVEDRGIGYSEMSNESSRALLKQLIAEYASIQHEEVANERLQRIESTGWQKVRFSFEGGAKAGDPLYYRIRNSAFVIEYNNKAFTPPQYPPDHQHSVWREFTNDWGKDSLVQ